MKKQNLIFLILGLGLFMIFSMTLNQGKNDSRIGGSSGVHLNVPATPSYTVYVQGISNMKKYINKGYQVQEVKDRGSINSDNHYFLMVKY